MAARELESRYDLVPLDTLEPDALAGIERVILAQPRALAPSENVSFDQWLTAGGEALIFADPMLTRHSEYPIGDRRRPQDVVLLSPLFDHWGLELTFDETQAGARAGVASRWPAPYGGCMAASCATIAARKSAHAPRMRARTRWRRGALVHGMLVLADAALLDWDRHAPCSERRKRRAQALLGGLFRRVRTRAIRRDFTGKLRDFRG